ncbi:MAG: 5-formyltetrahydrofolate cyclo-ligase [Sphingomonas bacterium]|nr:5-formyltetrahydrofolate cyclo-ligase [Sphingomonas bacterium]
MDKAALRSTLRARRRAFVADAGPERLAKMHGALLLRLVPYLMGTRVLSAYLATPGEIDPLGILLHAHGMGIRTALPRVVARDRPMTFHYWLPGDELVSGPFGLIQPREDSDACVPDLILAPLLGFDRALGRIGQGGGFYDRAFAANPAARRIGLAWSVQEVGSLTLEPWDVPLHGIATEREWIDR